jgi:ATP-dependent Clp protease protease subunit
MVIYFKKTSYLGIFPRFQKSVYRNRFWVNETDNNIETDYKFLSKAANIVRADKNQSKLSSAAPDLPSLLLENRIVYLGMPLISKVTELIIAELLYLQYCDQNKPISLYINSTGCIRADGEPLGFDTEGTAIYDTMQYVKNDIHTTGIGIAYGHACMLLSAGTKGRRIVLPNASIMLHQPRVPATGQRQAIEISKKWKEVASLRNTFLEILNYITGESEEKLWLDMQRPIYMKPKEALNYGLVDRVVEPEIIKVL